MTRREFLEALAAGLAAGLPLASAAHAADAGSQLYALPKRSGAVTLMHFTDCHAQLLPVHFREPDVNIGVGEARGRPPHLVGEALLKHFGVKRGTALAHAYTHLDFVEAARRYGKLGGFAHLATLVKRVRAERPGALLLDGGDNWQGSATALWTKGADMIAASKLLGVDVMTGHWEFTYGAARVQEIVAKELAGKSRISRAERADRGLRRSRFQGVLDPGSERHAGRHHRPGVPLYADRESTPLRV